MSLTRPFAWLASLVMFGSLATLASAQHPRINPFVEPDAFSPDLQFFAPAEVGDYSGREPPNTGFFFDYDKLYINVTRPDGADSLNSGFDGDYTWGNRFDFGYMTPDSVGWLASVWDFTGPNEYFVVQQERIDRRNPDDPSDGGGGTGGGGGGGNTTTEPILQDRNPRIYDVTQSINVANFSSFELNRVWRRKEFHNGGVFEPFIGVRYMTFKDFSRQDNYQRFASDADDLPDLTLPNFDGPWEIFDTARSVYENNMVGGQLGFRLSKQTGHWLLSTELRTFACANFQLLTLRNTQIATRYTGGEGSDVEVEIRTATRSHDYANQFVWGGEIRAEAAYEVTRDFNLRVGFTFLDLGQGIGRGLSTRTSFQDVQITGVTAGLTVNR